MSNKIETESKIKYFEAYDPITGHKYGIFSGSTVDEAAYKACDRYMQLRKNNNQCQDYDSDSDNDNHNNCDNSNNDEIEKMIYLRESNGNDGGKIYAYICSKLKIDPVKIDANKASDSSE